jgi:hypothetical protein
MKNYKNKQQSMKDTEVYQAWNLFINNIKYKKYFESNEEIWYENFNKLVKYLDTNNDTPSTESKEPEIKILGRWFYTQIKN